MALKTYCPWLDNLNPVHAPPILLFKIHFNIIFPSVPRCSKWPLSLKFPHQNHLTFSFHPYLPQALPISSRFDDPSNWWGVPTWIASLCKFVQSLFCLDWCQNITQNMATTGSLVTLPTLLTKTRNLTLYNQRYCNDLTIKQAKIFTFLTWL